MMQPDYPGRVERIRLAMDEAGVDSLLLSAGSDLRYFSGYEAMPLERLTMLVVSRSDPAVLVVPELEVPRVEPGPFEVLPWGETDDPIALVTRLAGRPSVAAVSDTTWAVFLLELLATMTETTFVPASRLTRELRMFKDPIEVVALADAASAVDRALSRIPNEVRFSGRRELDVARDVADLTVEEGHQAALFWIVAAGPNSASPHHSPGERVIGAGDAVVVDFGGRLDGYCSDVTRTFAVGTVSDDLRRVHQVVSAARSAAVDRVRPGVSAERVDAAARSVITEAGYGEYFIHRTGHGIGLDTHEHPYIVAGNRRPLESGMAFSVEPGIYLPGTLGVRIEDICVVTDDGVDVLNRADRALAIVE